MPQADVRALVAERIGDLQRKGLLVDARTWDDATAMQSFVRQVAAEVGCNVDSRPATSSAALHAGGTPNYCGPGHSSLLSVSGCLNGACRNHDACYAGCSERTGDSASCYWNDVTAPCDQTFFAHADACKHEWGTILDSEIVLNLAHLINGIGGKTSGCSAATSCPAELMAGFGPCAVNRKSTQCASCLATVDPGGECHGTACGWDPTDNICYAANCEATAKCFGWDKTPTPPPPPPDKCTPECSKGFRCVENKCVLDDEAPWSIVATRGNMSAVDPRDGDDWDGIGGGPPDPMVCLTFGGDEECSPPASDSDSPAWGYTYSHGASAAALRKGMPFRYTDVDFEFNDLICSGTITWTNEMITAGSTKVVCPADPDSWFELVLTPR